MNLGGPERTVKYMADRNEDFCLNKVCNCCLCKCSVDKVQFYKRSTWRMFHAWWTRTFLIIIGTVAFYFDGKAAKAINLATSLASFVLLMYAVLTLVNLCKYYLSSF